MLKKKPEAREDLAPFLRSLFFLMGLDEERFISLAEAFVQVAVVDGERIYSEGDAANDIYIVYDGKVRLQTGRGREKRDWDTLLPGDIFGEDLLFGLTRQETATALAPTQLLRLEKDLFLALLQSNSGLEKRIHSIAESRRLARRQGMKWIGADESIYFITRKHEYFLFISLILPILLGVAAFPLLALAIGSGSVLLMILTGLMALAAGILGIWFWEDWRNDYYIVTTQRVLWLEKVVLLYDSRQEAPLTTVLSKNVAFHQVLRRLINYGTVIVRTYTGSIVMRRASQPDLIIAFIDGLQARARALVRRAEEEKMDNLLRERLNKPPQKKPVLAIPPVVTRPAPAPTPKPGYFENLFTNVLKTRYEVGDRITYRKHWFVLLQKTILPALAVLGVLILFVILWASGILTGLVNLLLAIPLLLITGGWWLYRYVDWRNDQYVLTRDTIMDIERKPLSREEKRSAPLDNILSLEHARIGILGLLFNFGTVTINVGTEKFTFDNIYNPAQVQYEIFDRMMAQRQRKEEAEANKERERIVDWLSTYHRQREKLEVEEKESDWDIFSG
jgi:hypothetical protein